MLKKLKYFLFAALIFPLLFSFGIPKNVSKKVTKEIQKVFEVESYELNEIKYSQEVLDKLPAQFNSSHFQLVTNEDVILGYIYVDQAPSKTARFDYLLIFDLELNIKHSKVLIYREEYGGEIGSKRWLKQFIGKTAGDRVDHETNIDGIAGATISVRSMTNAIDNVLQSVAILKTNKVL